jgi:hypothetical protein
MVKSVASEFADSRAQGEDSLGGLSFGSLTVVLPASTLRAIVAGKLEATWLLKQRQGINQSQYNPNEQDWRIAYR